MTPTEYLAHRSALTGRPPKIAVHNGRTAGTLDELDFIARAEGMDPAEMDGAEPVEAQAIPAPTPQVVLTPAVVQENVPATPTPTDSAPATQTAPVGDPGAKEDPSPATVPAIVADAEPDDDLKGKTVQDLKGLALSLGIVPLPERKDDIKAAIRAKRQEAAA